MRMNNYLLLTTHLVLCCRQTLTTNAFLSRSRIKISTIHTGIWRGMPPCNERSARATASTDLNFNQLYKLMSTCLIHVFDKKRLRELAKEVDPNEQLDEDIEELLLHIADNFIEQMTSSLTPQPFFYVLIPYTLICNTGLTKLT